jgi:hypothetical protein
MGIFICSLMYSKPPLPVLLEISRTPQAEPHKGLLQRLRAESNRGSTAQRRLRPQPSGLTTRYLLICSFLSFFLGRSPSPSFTGLYEVHVQFEMQVVRNQGSLAPLHMYSGTSLFYFFCSHDFLFLYKFFSSR